jgi:hypothetical protein
MIDDNGLHEVVHLCGSIGIKHYGNVAHKKWMDKQWVRSLLSDPATMDDISTALNDHFPKP